MKRPTYTSNLFAVIFLCLGIVFLITGALCFVGIIKPSAHSNVQNPIILGIVFAMIGILFCSMEIIFRVVGNKQNKRHYELLEEGTSVMGTVEKVYLQKGIQYGRKSPFRIYYTYSHQNKIYHHKSFLLWDEPDFSKGDSIEVFANDFGKSTLKLRD